MILRKTQPLAVATRGFQSQLGGLAIGLKFHHLSSLSTAPLTSQEHSLIGVSSLEAADWPHSHPS